MEKATERLEALRLEGGLKAAIQLVGLSCAEVARRIDMHPSSLSRALAGKRNLTASELLAIMSVLATESDRGAAVVMDPGGIANFMM